MNFANIVKKQPETLSNENQNKEPIEIKEPLEFVESVEDKWSSYFSFNIIDLFSDLKYDFNILFNNCEINNFFDFVIKNSTVFDPYDKKEESDTEEEEEIDYYSD